MMMKSMTAILCCLYLILCVFSGCRPESSFPVVKGPYLGQRPPGMEPELFAPGLISTGLYERDLAMSADGHEIYYGLIAGGQATIMTTRLGEDGWTEPNVAPFADDPDFFFFEPCLSPEGTRLFFLSTLPPEGQESKSGWGHQNIWVVSRLKDGNWGEPQDVGPPVNTADEEYFPSVTRDGTVYFTRSVSGERKTRIMRSRCVNGAYAEPEALPEQVNGQGTPYNASISPGEDFLIACVGGRDDSVSEGVPDYYVFFRKKDDTWSPGINLGQTINLPDDRAMSPYVSSDGRYFFFASARKGAALISWKGMTWTRIQHLHVNPQNGSSDIYWVDARIIERLRPKGFE